MAHDELTVPERHLQQPVKPKAISLSQFLKTSARCDLHNNPMKAGRVECRAVPGKTGVAVIGEVHLSFMGCSCNYWRPLK